MLALMNTDNPRPSRPIRAAILPAALTLAPLLLMVLFLAPQGVRAIQAEELPAAEEHGTVEATFNDAPFAYEMVERERRPGYRIYRLRYPSPVVTAVEANNTVPADYYVPEGAERGPPRPAVICLHILNGNFELEEMVCRLLASRGIPAILPKLPYYAERSPPGGGRPMEANPALLVEALGQGRLDVRRTVDLLASRPEVHPERIGVVGISMGGILAASVAGSDARIDRAALILAGGDLPAIIGHARETRRLRELLEQ